MSERTLYSTDDEMFSHDDLGSVFDELESDDRLKVGESYFECTFRDVTFNDIFDMGDFIENIDERFNDLLHSEDHEEFDITKDGLAELQNVLNEWALKHLTFAKHHMIPVGESIEHKINENDL